MPGPILRNQVVKFFGTPQHTDGSVNEPRERREHGMQFNETWTYRRPRNDPAEAAERTIYWHRYDYVGSLIRKTTDGEWQPDETLPDFLNRTACIVKRTPC
jgi:hypothetical protein